MTTLTTTQREAVSALVNATLDGIKAAGDMGAPAGVLYAALSAHGCRLSQFESLIGALIRLGRVRRDGDLLFVVGED